MISKDQTIYHGDNQACKDTSYNIVNSTTFKFFMKYETMISPKT